MHSYTYEHRTKISLIKTLTNTTPQNNFSLLTVAAWVWKNVTILTVYKNVNLYCIIQMYIFILDIIILDLDLK